MEKKSSVSKLERLEDDAKDLIKLLNERQTKENLFKYGVVRRNHLDRFLNLSKFGKESFANFYDVMIIDAPLKTNQFNMTFVN